VSAVSVALALAGGIPLPPVPRRTGLGDAPGGNVVPSLQLANLCDCRDDLPGHPKTLASLVSGHVVRDTAETRRECDGPAKGLGAGQLSHCLDLAAQAPPGYGTSRPGSPHTGTIEVDETYLGGPKPGKRGRGAAGKTLVLVAAQEDGRRIGRIRLQRVADASAPHLSTAVQAVVAPGSTVRTDGWDAYGGLADLGYVHHVMREGAAVGTNLLPRVNRVVALLKRWLLGTHQGAVRSSHLDYYLDEFTFRFNRRTSGSRGMLFYRLMQQAVVVDPVPAKKIRACRRKP
jgi:transposase-like protein